MGFRALLFLLSASVLLTGCGSVASPSENRKETVTGTIPLGGEGEVHQFSVSRSGEYTIVLKSLSPPTGSALGVRLGQPQSGRCQYFTSNVAQIGQTALGGQIDKANYCFQFFDLGTMTQAETYVGEVAHP